MNKTALLFFALILSFDVFSQIDTTFWFAAPEVSRHTSDFDRPILLRLTTLDQSSTVKVSQPANSNFSELSFMVGQNSTQTIDLSSYIDQIESKPANSTLNTGILIRSSAPITAYYEVASATCNCNPEIFSLKGGNAAGNSFYIPTQVYFDNSLRYTPQAYSSFDIVSTEDNNVITITPKKQIVGHSANQSFNITLMKGEVYSAAATSHLASQHLAGSRVTSLYPISITVKDDLLEGLGQCRDIAGDQIVPIDNIGTEYIAVKGFLDGNRERISVIATEDNTSVYSNSNSSPLATIDAGEVYEVLLSQSATYINTSKPSYVWHTSGFGCELAGALLPPINCTGTFQSSFVRTTQDQFGIIIFVEKAGVANFSLNNSSSYIQQSHFSAIPGTSDQWYSARIELSNSVISAGSLVNIKNSTNLFHLGFINGVAGSGTRYGYFSDYAKITGKNHALSFCEDNELTLTTSNGTNYNWSTTETTSSIKVSTEGKYWVDYKINECAATDSFDVAMYYRNGPDFEDSVLCNNDSLILDLNPNQVILNSEGDTLKTNSIKNQGTYTVHTEGCKNSDQINLKFESPQISLGPDTTFCDSINLQLQVSDTFLSYVWNSGSIGNEILVKSPGTYWIIAQTIRGCESNDSITIRQSSTPKINLGNDTSVCFSTGFLLDAGTNSKILWQDGSTNRYFSAQSKGTFHVVVTNDDGCIASDTIIIDATGANQTIRFLPNSFTPDGNGINDFFPFSPEKHQPIDQYSLKIFSFWGEKLWESIESSVPWNGIYQGKEAQQGNYMYILSWKDCNNNYHSTSGVVMLLR